MSIALLDAKEQAIAAAIAIYWLVWIEHLEARLAAAKEQNLRG